LCVNPIPTADAACGEMIDETETRYFYRRRYGHALAFAEKQSPVIHLGPCKSCPDYSSPAESAGSRVRDERA
jgi:hypothetical protein